jgi:hypothetical protein
MGKLTSFGNRIDESDFTQITVPDPFLHASGMMTKTLKESLADDGHFHLPVPTTFGYGILGAGDGTNWMIFMFGSDGAVTKFAGHANSVATDTDVKFCIFDDTAVTTVRNRLGGTYVTSGVIWYD